MPTREERLAAENLRVQQELLNSETKLADAFEKLSIEMSSMNLKKPSRELHSAVQGLADILGGFSLGGVYDEVVSGAKSQVEDLRKKYQQGNAKYAEFLLRSQATLTSAVSGISEGLERFNAGESLGSIFEKEAEKFGFSMSKFTAASDKLAGINVPEPAKEGIIENATFPSMDVKDTPFGKTSTFNPLMENLDHASETMDLFGGKKAQKKVGKFDKLNNKLQKGFKKMPEKIAAVTQKFAKFIPVAGVMLAGVAALIPVFMKLENVVSDVVDIIQDLGQIGFNKVSDGIDFFLEQMSRGISGEAAKVAFGATAASIERLAKNKGLGIDKIRSDLAEFAEVAKIETETARSFTQGMILLGKNEDQIQAFQNNWMNKLAATGANATVATEMFNKFNAAGLVTAQNMESTSDMVAALSASMDPAAAESLMGSFFEVQKGIRDLDFNKAEGMITETFGAVDWETLTAGGVEGMQLLASKIETLDATKLSRLASEMGVEVNDLREMSANTGSALEDLANRTNQTNEQLLRENRKRESLFSRAKNLLGMILAPFLELLMPVRQLGGIVLDILTPAFQNVAALLRVIFVPIAKILKVVFAGLGMILQPLLDRWSQGAKVIGAFATKMGAWIDKAIPPMKKFFDTVFNSPVFKLMDMIVKETFKIIGMLSGPVFSVLWKVIKETSKFLWEVGEPGRKLVGWLWKMTNVVAGWLMTDFSFSEIWDKIKTGVSTAFSKIWDALKSVGPLIWEGLKAVGSLYLNIFKKVGSLIWEGLKFVGSLYLNIFKKVGSFIWEGLKSIGPRYIKLFTDFGSLIWEDLKSKANFLKDPWANFKTKIQGWIDILKNPFGAISEVFSNMSTSIQATFATIVNGLIDFASKIIPGANKLLGLDKYRIEMPKSEVPEERERVPVGEERLEQLQKRRKWQLFHKKDAPKRVLDDEAWADIERFTMPYDEKFNPQYPFKNSAITDVLDMGDEIPISSFTPATPQSIQTSQQQAEQTERNVDALASENKDKEVSDELLRNILAELRNSKKTPLEIQSQMKIYQGRTEVGRGIGKEAFNY